MVDGAGVDRARRREDRGDGAAVAEVERQWNRWVRVFHAGCVGTGVAAVVVAVWFVVNVI